MSTRNYKKILHQVSGKVGIFKSSVSPELIKARAEELKQMAEDAETGDMVVEDCVKVSRAISAVLDVEDPIDSNYNLEVSSPGIDRPLVREQDFKRFAGFEARIDTRAPVGGSKRFNGRLLGIKEGIVTINVEGEDVELAFPEINKAKLLLTDELIAAFEGQRKQ